MASTGGHFQFEAGQYIRIALPDANCELPLSIGSAPQNLPHFDLYYRSTPDLPAAQAFDALLRNQTYLTFRGPYGKVQPPTINAQPMLLIAAGTGAGQAFSLLGCAYHDDHADLRHTLVQMAARSDELIAHPDEVRWQARGLRLQRFADPTLGPANQGLRWLRDHALEFTQHWVLLSGAPGFVYAALDVLIAAGINTAQTHSDVYEYAPR